MDADHADSASETRADAPRIVAAAAVSSAASPFARFASSTRARGPLVAVAVLSLGAAAVAIGSLGNRTPERVSSLEAVHTADSVGIAEDALDAAIEPDPGEAMEPAAPRPAGGIDRPQAVPIPEHDRAPRLREHDRSARLFSRSLRALDAGGAREALEDAAGAWSLNDTDPRIANHLASVHLELAEPAPAETWCLRALALDPELARAWTNLGVALLLQDRAEEAADAYRRALEAAPGDWKAFAGLAAAERALGDPSAAVATLTRALVVAPHRFELRYAMGLSLERSGDLDGARAAFSAYLELSRGSDPGRETRVREWLARHRAAE